MKKFFTKGIAALMALFALTPLTAKAVDVVELQPNDPQTLAVTVFSTSSSVAYPYQAKADGTLIASIASTSFTAYTGTLKKIWFTEDVSGKGSSNYEELVAAAAPNQDYQKLSSGTSTVGSIEAPAQIWWVTDVKAGDTFYFYVSYAAMSKGTFTIELLPASQGGGDVNTPTTPEDVVLQRGVPTKLLKNQKGTFSAPDEADIRSSLEIKLTVNTTAELNEGNTILFQNNSYNTAVDPKTTTVEGGNTIFTYSNYVSYGPWYVMQTTEEEIEVTLSFPQYDETLETVELDKEFTVATADSKYQFEVEEAMILTVTSPVAMTEQQWNRIVYKDQAFNSVIYTSSEFEADGEANDEGLTQSKPQTEANFKLSAAGTYYLKCPNTGVYKLTKYVAPEAKDPFQTTIVLTSPIEGVSEALNWVIKFTDQELDDSASLLSGASITNPNGKQVKIYRTYLTTAGESSKYEDALGLMIDSDDYDLCRVLGDYIVYLPEGIVYNKNGEPNPETTLNYTLKPTAVEGEPEYFEIDEMTTNVPDLWTDGYVVNSVNNLVLTFPWDLDYYSSEDDADEIDSFRVTVNGEKVDAEIENNNTIVVPVGLVATTSNLDVTVRFDDSLVQATIGGEVYVNPPMNVMFTLYAATAEATFDPEDNTTFYANETEKAVTVTWNGGMMFNNADYDFDNSGITMVDGSGKEVELVYFENVDTNSDSTGIVFDLSEMAADTYTITIPKASVLVAESDDSDFGGMVEPTYTLNKAVTASFIVSDQEDPTAVSIVASDANGLFHIYNLNGVKVAEGKANTVKALPAGIYVINGKKVVVK